MGDGVARTTLASLKIADEDQARIAIVIDCHQVFSQECWREDFEFLCRQSRSSVEGFGGAALLEGGWDLVWAG